jgi:eukaryotic-like serine/threonine-protein kinase
LGPERALAPSSRISLKAGARLSEDTNSPTVVRDIKPRSVVDSGLPPTDSDELLPGTQVDGYTILEKLGSGGCASVFLARDAANGRRVAVKVLRREWVSSEEMLRRFLYEVRAVNTIAHPAIVEIYRTGVLPDGRPFFAMEFLDGPTLLGHASLHGRFDASEAMALLAPVCAALEAAHAVGIVHRDLKASNIMVVSRGATRVVKLLDFGIAKFLYPEDNTPALTRLGARLGTPSTMSPEQLRGQPVDGRSDIYSLGILLYRLLVGRHPFESSDLTEVERMHLEEPPPHPSGFANVSPAVDRVVLRCLQKDREHRYPTVRELVEDLRRAAEESFDPDREAENHPAVGIYVEARMLTDDPDENMLTDFAVALDLAEQSLRASGMQLPLVTGNSLLAVKVMSTEPAARQTEYREALALATALFDELHERSTKDSRLHINLSLHFDRVEIRNKVEVAGGAITRVADWAAKTEIDGVFVSRRYLDAIPGDLATRLGSVFRTS